MSHIQRTPLLAVATLLLVTASVVIAPLPVWRTPKLAAAAPPDVQAPAQVEYRVIAWNDLGMHCYNPSFQELAVLPPWNTLYAQVVRIGDPPAVVTTGLTVEYFFEDNTYSVGKSDFWDISPYQSVQNAQWLFGLPAALPADVGLAGLGLAGPMTVEGDHFKAEGIPLTEYGDSAPDVRDPFQLATVVVRNSGTGAELARVQPVAPVSTEMHCEWCHYDGGPGNDEIATGNVYQNILTAHDQEHGGSYPAGYSLLMDSRPVLCAWCHASNALGAPGEPGIPNFSSALHLKHSGKIADTQAGCYSCHPGPQTQCQRDVMFTQFGMSCPDCHGTMADVGNKLSPWLEEPRCDTADCHGSVFAQDNPLYRLSRQHGGLFCEACHDSTHAITPSREPKDGIKFVALQDYNGTLRKCTVCHATQPALPGPHGLTGLMAPAWEREVWSAGVVTVPGSDPVAVAPNASIDVVDRVQVSGGLTISYTMAALWPDSLTLTGYQVSAGSVSVGAGGTLEWAVNGELADTWYTMTRTWTVSAPYGSVSVLTDSLAVEGRAPALDSIALQAGYRAYLPVVSKQDLQ